MKRFLIRTGLLIIGIYLLVVAPLWIANIIGLQRIQKQSFDEPTIVLGDSHAEAFYRKNDAIVLSQIGMPLSTTFEKFRSLLRVRPDLSEKQFIICIGPHNFLSSERQTLQGISSVSKSRFQYFQTLYEDQFQLTFRNVGYAIRNYRQALKGAAIQQTRYSLVKRNYCERKCDDNRHLKSYNDEQIVWDEELTHYCDSFISLATEKQIKYYFTSPTLSVDYWLQLPKVVRSKYATLTNSFDTLQIPLYVDSCSLFRDCDHLNRTGADWFLSIRDHALQQP